MTILPIFAEPIDLWVYQLGGRTWSDDASRLYAVALPATAEGGRDLPFTYPPIAAVLFTPLAALPWRAAVLLLTVAGFAALTAACLTAARRLYGPGQRALLVALGAATIGMLLDPARMTVLSGQINLLLMGLVVVDCLVPTTRWPSGALVGLAAAIKLTPLVFLLFFVVRRQWRPAATALVTFLGLGLLGFLLAPQDSVDYWFSALYDTGRVGGAAELVNQSLRGTLARLGLDGAAGSVVWFALCVGVAALLWPTVRRAREAGDDLVALLLVATAGLLVSPVSWVHHWVWIVPALPLLGRLIRTGPPAGTAGAVVLFLVFLVGLPLVALASGLSETAPRVWAFLLGDGYVLVGTATLLVGAYVHRARSSWPVGVDELGSTATPSRPR